MITELLATTIINAIIGQASSTVFDWIIESLPKDSNKNSNLLSKHIDALTGLPTKESIEDFCKEFTYDDEIFVAYIDADSFKLINDLQGHACGDYVLTEIGLILKEVLAAQAFRMGGDEFLLISEPNVEKEIMLVQMEMLQQLILKSPFQEKLSYPISISVGVCFGKFVNIDSLINNADQALILAKRTQKGSLIDYEQYSDSYFKVYDYIKDYDLNNLSLSFQPIVNCETKVPVALEALVRCYNENDENINTQDFLAILSAQGRMMQLDFIVIKKVLEFNKMLQSRNINIPISINISPESWGHPAAAMLIDRYIKEITNDFHDIIFEIPESLDLFNSRFMKNANHLIQLGYRLAIDDLGGGYINYAILDLPLEWVKIDRGMLSQPIALKHTLEMVNEMKKEVVMEGVETIEELNFITGYHVKLIQGYLFSRPLDKDSIIIYLESLGEEYDG